MGSALSSSLSAAVLAAAAVSAGCSGDKSLEGPTPTPDFVIAVGSETFVMRTTDPDTAQRAMDNLNRRNRMFPGISTRTACA